MTYPEAAIADAENALARLDEAKGDWDATDSDAAKRWYHAATYEAVIEVEIERGDWDEVIHAATRMREILNGD